MTQKFSHLNHRSFETSSAFAPSHREKRNVTTGGRFVSRLLIALFALTIIVSSASAQTVTILTTSGTGAAHFAEYTFYKHGEQFVGAMGCIDTKPDCLPLYQGEKVVLTIAKDTSSPHYYQEEVNVIVKESPNSTFVFRTPVDGARYWMTDSHDEFPNILEKNPCGHKRAIFTKANVGHERTKHALWEIGYNLDCSRVR
jgi:hypothetical protein